MYITKKMILMIKDNVLLVFFLFADVGIITEFNNSRNTRIRFKILHNFLKITKMCKNARHTCTCIFKQRVDSKYGWALERTYSMLFTFL